MAHWYLARYFGDTVDPAAPFWRPPTGAVAAIDFRPTAAQASIDFANPAGFGFFGFNATQTLTGATYYGNDLAANQNLTRRNAWRNALGIAVALDSVRLIDILAETLGTKSDPGATLRAKPVRPTTAGRLDIWLGTATPAFSRDFEGATDAHWPRIQTVEHDDYRAVRARCLALANAIENCVAGDGSVAASMVSAVVNATGASFAAVQAELAQRQREKYLRYLGGKVLKYRMARGLFIPPDLTDEGELPPETTIGDDFTEASDTTLTSHTATGANGGFSWSAVVGTATDIAATDTCLWASATGSIAKFRAQSDLSSDDHYSQVLCVASGSTTRDFEALTRFASAATTCYGLRARPASNTYGLYKTVAGVVTLLGSTVSGAASPVGATIRCESDGSDHEGYRDGVLYVGPQTDTAITGNLRCGFGFAGSVVAHRVDNFEAADLGGGPATYTATASLTAGAATLSASATFAPGTKTATAALSAGSATLAASASFAPGTKTAAAALTAPAATLAASATFDAPAYTAAAGLSAAPATLAATATHAAPVYTAAGALTAAPATLAATAVFATAVYQATASLAAPAATLAATATFTAPVYTAAGALVATGATLAASATFAMPVFTASGALVASAAILSATATFGDFTAPVLSSWTATPTGPTTATLQFTTDESGTAWAVVVIGPSPTREQIAAGEDANGDPAVWAGDLSIAGPGTQQMPATGLTPTVAYNAYAFQRDNAGNASNIIQFDPFTQPSEVTDPGAVVFGGEDLEYSRTAGALASVKVFGQELEYSRS